MGASTSGRCFLFDTFQLDVASHRLWRGKQIVPVRPKSWDLLQYFVERPGHLVTKDAVHRHIWPDTAVSDDTITQSIRELRRALGDDARTPRFIETVHGRGFRFVAEVRELSGPPHGASDQLTTVSTRSDPAQPFVGRQAELAKLEDYLKHAREGVRQVVLVTGEAGIGKTALVEAFLRSAATESADVCVLRGQCIQQHGEREPYMPVLEALERLLSAPAGEARRPLLRRVAPCWYVQMPALLAEGDSPEFPTAPLNAPAERMLREGARALESLGGQSTVVLVLEDLHWSDAATTDLLSYVAQRPDPARLLVLGTYRPAEASVYEHPIREVAQTLRLRRRCLDLALDSLSLADVRRYLLTRFGSEWPSVARLIHERSDGNPLFVIAIVDELIRRGQLTQSETSWTLAAPESQRDLAVPDDVLEMIAEQFQRLPDDERSLLEAASVAGIDFEADTVARAMGRDAEEVEALAERMARSRLFLSIVRRAADGEGARHYEFAHALHHQVIYRKLPDHRRRRLHQTVGEILESTAGERTPEIASELSIHFERSGDLVRAVKYLRLCVARAEQRFAPKQAVDFAAHALGLVQRLPESAQRGEQELAVRLLLGIPLSVTQGYSSTAVRENYDRARVLCETVGNVRQLFEIVHAVWYWQLGGAEGDGARESVDELARIAERLDGTWYHWRAKLARGRTELWNGRFGVAVPILLQCIEDITNQTIELKAETYGVDPILAAFTQSAVGLWFIGSPDRARAQALRGLAHAENSRRPFELASALCHTAMIELLRGDTTVAGNLAARATELCADHDIADFLPISRFLLGAAVAERADIEAGLALMLQGLADQRKAMGPFASDIMLASIAAAYGRTGQWDEALRYVDEGIELCETNLERVYAAELWRVKGELLYGRAGTAKRAKEGGARIVDAADACFQRALAIARRQEARSIELRSAMSIVRLAPSPERARDARKVLRAVLGSFTEGFDTKDLQDAKALLNRSA
jgi:DNA-binding winged helix-turn-helix (wHTH) protein/tetratricopeptide (TPR) repeat protein